MTAEIIATVLYWSVLAGCVLLAIELLGGE